MEFVNPGFLFALLALAVPVIIHLFNFRKFKKVYFTNVSFLQDLKQQTQKQSRIKHLLVLLMRMLALAAIIIAFAQPYIPSQQKVVNPNEQNAVSIFVDNSFSMQAESEKGILLEDAKEKAREIVSAYKESDRFQLLTNDFEGRHQFFVSRDEVLDMVDDIKISPVVKSINEAMNRQKDLLNSSKMEIKTSYIVSDFQKSFVSQVEPHTDTAINFFLIPIPALNTDNIFIDSCWFEAPVQQKDQSVLLNVKIKNLSDNGYEKIPLRLRLNGQQKSLASFDLSSQSETNVTLAYTNSNTGIQFGQLEIDDYPVNFDDQLFFSYTVSSLTKILCINGDGENLYLNSLFRNDSSFLLENRKQGTIDYSSFANYGLIILNELNTASSGLAQEIERFVKNGGSIMIIPSIEMDMISINQMLSKVTSESYNQLDTARSTIKYINLEHPIYADVFDEIPENLNLPVVFQRFGIQVQTTTPQEVLLRLQNGGIFLNVQNSGKGKVYLLASPLQNEYSNFAKHAIFVPTLYKIAISSVANEKLYYTLGQNEVIQASSVKMGNDEVFRIKKENTDFEVIPDHRMVGSGVDILVHDQINEAGNYILQTGQNIIKGLSFNNDRTESALDFYTHDELTNWLSESKLSQIQIVETGSKSFAQTITELNRGISLWAWFVLITLVFLLAEVLLLRLWK